MTSNPNPYPAPEGYQWINKNVDLLTRDGRRFCNVRFIAVETIVQPTIYIPGEYIWVIDDYYSGGAPIRRRIDPKDVIDINQAGYLCGPVTTMPPMPPNTTTPPPMPPQGCGWRRNWYTGQWEWVCI
ncbi:hypothetical protein VO178_09755 [Lysinibacillus fusiformis]|uniref:hypothetical protein n=1 Tax=Lysinibacillus fusiformis TaxID=28031 RepID=UPI002D78D818|nr:hypothetical protein [Lysinibacillus fusiformis]WRS99959.1 hypothetical protein VO178_09755 [Lysinibacillus fusiformis]